MKTIKCHKCGKTHRQHTAFTVYYNGQEYSFSKKDGYSPVEVGETCAIKIWKQDKQA